MRLSSEFGRLASACSGSHVSFRKLLPAMKPRDHGWLALRNGDSTALREGRLPFNPIDHIDPLGTILLPLLCVLAHIPPIGWAKPVPVNSRGLRDARNLTQRRAR